MIAFYLFIGVIILVIILAVIGKKVTDKKEMTNKEVEEYFEKHSKINKKRYGYNNCHYARVPRKPQKKDYE